jgi:hypothetical protein
VPDPVDPAEPTGDRNRVQGAVPVDARSARETLLVVRAWIVREMFREAQSPSGPPGRNAQLRQWRAKCETDLKALVNASPEEMARISDEYAAFYRRVTGQ